MPEKDFKERTKSANWTLFTRDSTPRFLSGQCSQYKSVVIPGKWAATCKMILRLKLRFCHSDTLSALRECVSQSVTKLATNGNSGPLAQFGFDRLSSQNLK